MIKNKIRKLIGERSILLWSLQQMRSSPIAFPGRLFASFLATQRLTGRPWPILVRVNHSCSVRVKRDRAAKAVIKGILSFEEWGGVEEISTLSIGQGAQLIIDGDFIIGPGVHILISREGSLRIGGRKLESGSGITCRSRIMVERSLSIGYDCIIAFGVYLTDSDWHSIEGKQRCLPVNIGDHVWVAHDVSVLKGAEIANGCIVAPKSTVTGRFETEACLLAGSPAKVKREHVQWSR
jgi:acetyltransferase-like isoleucine patch superfamily enzyme